MARWVVAALVSLLSPVLLWGPLGQAGPPPQPVQVVAGSVQNEFVFSPREIVVQAGQPVTLTLVNKGKIDHDLSADGLKIKIPASSELVVAPGKSATVTFTLTRKGTYEFVCSIPGHKEAGMKGTLVVK